ncbi:endonuclease domain-containing 1 protein-like [Oenanthe melanoleuca]|uniref:endonuclease domain-containing 1 protein-like n=1 Tax=Oenanthe melanoleuca TaxID=2939378 RepID=UPI0024C1EED8|nr:endonuclease domain-containing 1 protein-like [Oenanthe melanoleuca]
MLGLLLLQVLASCLSLGHSEVVKTFKTKCTDFFYAKTVPSFNSLHLHNAARICQVYDNQYRFATLYNKTRRIPVYSAYIYQRGNGERYDSWFVEPQLINETYSSYMDTEESIREKYHITSQDIGQNQAIDRDYSDATGLDRGHLCPSGHRRGNASRWATFTLTNIVPQYSTLNQGAWREYEDTIMRNKTDGCDKTYVITGAVPGNNKVPSGRVNIPSHIWSAACCLKKENGTKAWGAIAENERNKNKVKVLKLGELEERLTNLYEGAVTLFNNACVRK